ncbi:hypothetical protein BD289DRAFT_433579 [Coniella lustricola]|uniref:Uncharacterized protein n=1 Tax=Coniella lustricola TaxID=2025994 RepID=A0A2T3A8A9_9PEZI|nr:hypothetical protein BD289DRAFT_433579 [Coniella lustricola]
MRKKYVQESHPSPFPHAKPSNASSLRSEQDKVKPDNNKREKKKRKAKQKKSPYRSTTCSENAPAVILNPYFRAHAPAKSPTLSSHACSSWVLRRSFQPFLLRSCRRRPWIGLSSIHADVCMGPAAAAGAAAAVQVGATAQVEAPPRTGARLADRLKGAGVVKILASASLAMAGAGPRISATPRSRIQDCLNHVRSRWKKAGLGPIVMNRDPSIVTRS